MVHKLPKSPLGKKHIFAKVKTTRADFTIISLELRKVRPCVCPSVCPSVHVSQNFKTDLKRWKSEKIYFIDPVAKNLITLRHIDVKTFSISISLIHMKSAICLCLGVCALTDLLL